MAENNVQLMKSLYAAFAKGDAGTVFATFDPQIVWTEAENFAYADGNPYVGAQRIGEGIFGRLATEWDGFAVIPEQFIGEGNTVVSTGRYRGTYKATGVPVDAQFVHVWTIRNGKVATFQQYTDTLQFARAMGQIAAV
jgi:uncharacterized protein